MHFAAAAFGALTFALPADFRREYARAMQADFRDAVADASRDRGPFATAGLVCVMFGDLLLTILGEYGSMIFRDFAFALRSIRKTPLFAAVIIATLALAIGANAAAFSVLRAVVLAPLPYPAAERLVAIDGLMDGKSFALSLPDFYDLRAQSRTLVDAAAFFDTKATLTGRGRSRVVRGVTTTTSLFDTLEARPELGRLFDERDGRAGSAQNLVISDAFWRGAFDGDAHVIGSAVTLDGQAYRIIGVVAPTFEQPSFATGFSRPEYWQPLPAVPSSDFSRGAHYLDAVGRVRDGASIAAARLELHVLFARLRQRYVIDDARFGVEALPLTDKLVGGARPLLYSIFAAVAGVLLVACANVTNLMLARAATRDRELAVRLAIGATRGRIVVQLLTETFVIVALGGVAGVALAAVAIRAFVALDPPGIPRVGDAGIDLLTALYTLGVVAFCTLASGLAPALALSRVGLADALKAAGRSGDASRGRRARTALMIAEIALTLPLVIGAGLFARSFVALTTQPLGFDAATVSAITVRPSPRRYPNATALAAFDRRILERVRAVPGVSATAWSCCAPFSGSTFHLAFGVVGHAAPAGQDPSALTNIVSEDYFSLLGIPLLQGRAFDAKDGRAADRVAIVNAAFARTYLGNQSPLGRRITWGGGLTGDDGKPRPQRTIIGIAGDVRDGYAKPQDPMIYLPSSADPSDATLLLVRSAIPAAADAAADVVADIDPELPHTPARPYSAYFARDAARARLGALGLGTLAAVALVLAVAGIFAVVSYGVAQRTHEFGIRMALGARAGSIVRDAVGGALRASFVGVILGLALASIATSYLQDQLYATGPLDRATFIGVTIGFALASLAAAFVPARRATRVDPVVALRCE